MEQNPSPPPPPPQRPQMDPSYQSNVQHGVSQMPNTEQHPRILAPKQTAPLTTPKPIPPPYPPKPPITRGNWVNAFWADISGQLRRLSVISGDLFDGLLLRRTTHTGSLILNELVSFTALCCALFLWSCCIWYRVLMYPVCVSSGRNMSSWAMIGIWLV